MGDTEGGSEQDDVSFLRTEDMVCLVTGATGERVGLAAEGFGNRHCFLENIADKNNPPDLTQCVFVIEQALSVRALQELVTAAASESGNEAVGKGTGSGHRTLLYGNAILLRHQNSNMYLACLSTTSGNDKLAFDVGLQEHSQGEACWWTVHPASKQRSEGEKVRVGDDLILVSVATERYLQAVREGDQMIVNASFHVTHWSVQPFGTGLSRLKFVGCVFGGEVLRFFHGGDECLTIPPTWSETSEQNIVVYEGGDVVSQARSLWRLELGRTKWAGGFINWMHPLRIRHITSGRYLGVNENNDLILVHRNDATLASTAFYLREEKDDQRAQLEDKDLEVIGSPLIKYGDTTVIVQHMETGLWLSYRAYETKKKGVGKVEEKQAILHEEGKMDDGLEFSRSQEEESRTGRVIRKCSSLFTKFIKALEILQVNRSRDLFFGTVDLNEMIMCLEDLINYFAQPEDEMEHEERQNRFRALRNRQDLFQEEGILNLTLEAIDNINTITERGYLVTLASDASQNFEVITGYLYQLLAAIIKGNHTNCAQFANVNRLNWLFSRLGSQASGEGSGMLDVLHCVLIDSPEALNMMREEHIKVIISLLEKHGRDPKVLDVLCSLCVGNGVAVRSSQNNICDYLLPGKNLLLHTGVVDHVGSVRPNIFVGKVEGSAVYQKWYFEVTLDHIEQASHMMPHMRIGWANTIGYCPYPGGGEHWGGNGVGDDLCSYGFDGVYLWTGGRSTCVVPGSQEPYIRKGDVIGCALDLTVPSITFYFNGVKIRGGFKNFNSDGMFHPAVSMSAKVSCRFLFGGDQGRLRYPPPELHSPIVECLLPTQVLQIDPCFYFGDPFKTTLAGPLKIEDDTAFVPKPVDTEAIILAGYVEQVRDKLAENIHEMWAMNKIEAGWMYGDYRDDYEKYHPCLVPFDRLPGAERRYDIQLAENTLKTIMALGYHISLDKPPSRIRSIRLPNDPFLQPNGYKPAPLDLSAITLTPKLEELIDQLAENTHNIWSKERIMEGWTYGLNEDPDVRRSPHLVPYSKVDEAIKVANWDTASETVRTLLVYGYVLEAPTGESQEVQTGEVEEKRYADFRTYRAEKTYAVSNGKWYYEFEVLTAGPMRVGWARVDCKPGYQIGSDEYTWAFDGYNAEKVHQSSNEPYGKVPQIGDTIGCMIDVENKTLSFSLNGELLMDSLGGETAFTDVQGEGFVPACTLGIGQRARFCFGHDVNALKFFTTCGLQEGYEPFCVNMNRAMTFWYTKDQPIFENIDDGEDSSIDVIRIPAGSDTPPSLRLSHKTFETMEKANWEFLRLSLPVICLDEFIDEDEKNRRWQEIRVRQHRLRATGQYIRTDHNLEQTIQKAGFTMSDIKDLQRGYSEDAAEGDADAGLKDSDYGRGELSRGDLLTPGDEGKKKERGKSPFRFFSRGKKDGKDRTPDPEDKAGTRGTNVRLTEGSMKIQPPAVPDRARKGAGGEAAAPRDEPPEGDIFDAECLSQINEYFFGVRIFPGQDPTHVYVGWVTCQYHFHSQSFTNEKVRHCTIAGMDEYDTEVENVDRSSCYMVRADELYNQVSADSGGKGASQGMFIGCTVDTATGYINFYCEGKPTKYIYKMEPGTKLFPAVFAEATSKEMLQFELGRTATTLPLSSAVLLNSGKHLQPQFPPRLKVQYLRPHQWARVPNINLKVHALKLSELRGWSTLCEDSVSMLALHIPEEDRCIDILELIEMDKLLSFHYHTLTLYAALCYQSNFRAAHSLCAYVDQKQLLYAIQAEYLSGPLRRGFYDLLIALHMESFSTTMEVCKNEFIIPLIPELKELYEDESMRHSVRSVTTISIRPEMTMTDIDGSVEDLKDLSSPYFPLEIVRDFTMTSIAEAVRLNQVHIRDPIGGSNENLFVPLLKLIDKLLLIGIINDDDLDRLLVMIDPQTWDPEKEKSDVFKFQRFPSETEDEEDHRKGLLFMELAEGVKLQLCYLLHHLNDIQLRHRVESIVAFSHDYVGEVQADQLKRYVEIKRSDLPSAIAAKKTREFRCPPIEQTKCILGFKLWEEIDDDNRPCAQELIDQLREYHDGFVEKLSLEALQDAEEGGDEGGSGGKLSMITKMIDMLNIVKKLEPPAPPVEEEPPRELLPEEKFRKVLTKTIVRWAEETQFETPLLVKEMFGLLIRQYDTFGEVIRALEKTYVFSCTTIDHIHKMWRGLSRIRALLPVQMSQEEEALMRFLLWELVNNHIFFQHPDLIRILRVHENVMALMMNTLGRAQVQSEAQGAPTPSGEGAEQPAKEKDTSHEMVVACCRFLCFFCRTSRQNQKAMFEHLGFLLENSNILLSRPSLRGSTPLDVAYSSLMENTELALALREHLLEKVAVYLSRTGLQSNGELVEKGYPDLGWDPVEGERYLDFLRFCVWVGGESVEENANLVIRLLIRRPECLGPNLRGEGDGLLRAIIDANKFSDRISARNEGLMDSDLNHPMPESEEDEDYIDTGAAILAFYCTLVDLLGRCAPDATVIALGKNESLRARAILRSLVPLEDLVGALSLRFSLQPLQRPGDTPKRDMPPGLVPNHKQSIVRFLERVYGVEERDLFMRLLEDAFLPDLRAATMLDRHDGGDSEMGLALNRYIGNSILPLLIKHSRFYADADNYASLLDASLHTVYRLSKNKMLTKGQREAVSDFLVALTRELYPNMLLKLLRKLTVDVSKLSEYTTVALRLLTLHYERCSKYYGAGGQGAYGSASEEEKRLTMMLFSNIFESLAKMEYDPDLFGKALPCLSAIGCALPPDYSLSAALDGELVRSYANEGEGPYNPDPIDTSIIQINGDLNNLVIKFSEHWHDAWARRKLNNGWKYGEPYNWHERIHPRLKPYSKLTEYEKERYKEPIRDGIKALLALSWTIEQGDVDMASRSSNTRRSSKADLTAPDTQTPFNYHPNPVDMTNMTLNREMQTMAERLAENLHDIWARKKKDDIDNNGGPPHPLVVPYDLLTDKEKRKDRDRMNELLKYVQYQGYRLYRLKVQGESEEDTSRAAAQCLERRFAYSLLEKLLHYLDVSSVNLKSQVPSNNYSRRSTFKDTTRDVKFFTKVVLPLMEKYFNTHRTYFISIATGGAASGAASLKEKEMVASLFCRLTTLLRSKLNSFGSDVKMTVRCLQVLIKAFDAKSITKSCPEFIRTSMLTFFNNAADDLGHTIINLQEKKYSHLRGTHLVTATSLNYVNSVLLPVLTSLFDHLAAYDYGADLILDDLQVASYKMLSSLYQLGTDMTLHKNRKYMKIELERYRPAIGSCLGAFASTFPIAFLEPALNKNNPNSVYHKLFEQSPQTAQDVMSRLGSNIPGLDAIIQEVENYVEAGKTYNEIPHIIDITLPMLCSYLPYWWSHGPDNATNVASDSHVSNVTVDHMNKLLKSVLNLIKANIGNEQAMWMTRIAQFTQQIIINSAEELLTDPILPLAEKLRKKSEQMFHKEESVRGFLKSGTDDSSQIESQIQDEWQLLTRDIYAFYPLLIKYVDYQRNNWLKNNTLEAEHLYNHIAEIFNIWSKSQYFRREETNFISANEIDNMALIMPTSTRRTVMSDTSVQSGGKIKKKKKSRDKKRDKDKELASSLLVACLKRLLPVGLNLFAGREQELVQHCKDRYLKKMQDYEIVDYATTQLTLPDKIDPSDAMSWQHHLYSKLGAKRETSPEETNEKAANKDKDNKEQLLLELVDRIVAMAKVLYGLHMATFPPDPRSGWRRLLSAARKKAALACLLSVPYFTLKRHRAINLFLRTYKDMWLVDENVGQEVMIEHLTQTFEEAELKKKEEEEEEAKPDPLQQLVTTFTRGAMTERSGALQEDPLYMAYAEVMAKSCGEEEEEGGDEEEGEGPSIHEQEMEKQKLLFHQARLANRGVAEMVLLHISASKGSPSEMVMQTLGLGISILRGGNIDVQMQMLNHLKEKKDAGFFTSIAGLMNSCTVLDLDAFERNTKAEGLGVGPEGAAGEKNMHDAEFTCALFRFIQLTCEGHNLDWQNYLRTQAGNTTTVNVVICTVDYLLRLQESIMDFYWHYSSKELIDPAGKVNFFKAIGVASQVFNTLTEVIQGPCTQNQQALAHSRLWDAIGGFLFLFAHMQAKLSKNSSQVDLLKEMLNLQKDMVIMMLSMLEGNVVNGTIGKQMVDTLVESASNVEIILRYFDMFLKLKDLTSSSTFQEDMDKNKDGYVSPKEFKDSLEASKNYSAEEIDFLLLCCDTNHDGKIDYVEFTERFHNPAKEIGFNLAVLLTNLSEHMPNEPRLARFLETAGSVLNYFEPYLGRIEIMGSSKKIERVYFEILESNIEQWEKPQIKESKRAFFYAIVTEGGDKEKLQAFVDFCEDAIFEMQHASALMSSDEEGGGSHGREQTFVMPTDDEEEKGTLVKQAVTAVKDGAQNVLSSLSPSNIKKKVHQLKQMTPVELIFGFFKMLFWVFYAGGAFFGRMLKYVGSSLIVLMRGPPPEKKEEEKPADEFAAIKAPALPASTGPPEEESAEGGVLAIMGSAEAAVEEGASRAVEVAGGELAPVEAGGEESGERALVVRAASPVKEAKDEKAEAPAAAASPLDEVEAHDEPSVASQIDFGSYFNGMVSFLARNFYNMKIVALVLAFTINFMLLFFKATALVDDEDEDAGDDLEGSGYEGSGLLDSGSGSGNDTLEDDGDEDEEDDDVPELVQMDEKFLYMAHLMRFLSVIHSIISMAMLFAYYHLKIPLAIFKREKEIARRLEFDGLYLAEQPEDDDLKAHWDRLVISAKSFPVNYWDKFVKKKVRQKYSETYDFDQISNLLGMEKTSFSVEEKTDAGILSYFSGADWRYQVWKAGVTLTDNAFLYSLWYFCFSILGNFNYFFFAAHLLDVAVAVPALKTILQSVTHNGKQLVLTVMLLSIVVYIYTVIAFNFFRKFYVTEEDDEVDQKCHDMATCFVFHLYQGVRAGGGIGDVIEPPDGEPSEVYRIFFDITFFFFVIVILLAIIQGLIIDAFGELRDQLNSVSETLESECFICGIGKDYFDVVPHGFDVHVLKEHNLANYMFFLMHLINKPDTEYTGQETYVWNMYQQRSWDFFPVGDCFRKQYEEELSGKSGGE